MNNENIKYNKWIRQIILLEWFKYKNSGKNVADNDVSREHVEEYAALYGFSEECVKRQENETLKYETLNYETLNYEIRYPESNPTVTFRGDTLTSVWTPFRGYLETKAREGDFCWNKNLFTQTTQGKFSTNPYLTDDDFKTYFLKLMCLDSRLHDVILNLEGERKQLLLDICDILPDSFFDFLESSKEPGNLIICPINFNSPRGKKASGEYDTKDYLAFRFSRYFTTNHNIEELKKIGDAKNKIDIDRLLEFFEILGINDLKTCREKLFLQDLIDEKGRVTSLKTGEKIPEDCKDFNPKPESEDEYKCFFQKDAEITRKRTRRMMCCVRE